MPSVKNASKHPSQISNRLKNFLTRLFTSSCSSPVILSLKVISPHRNTHNSPTTLKLFAALQTHKSPCVCFHSPHTRLPTFFTTPLEFLLFFQDSASFSEFPCFREHVLHCIVIYVCTCLPLSLYNFNDFVVIG